MYKSKESEERNRIAGEIMEILKKEHLTVGTAIIILESVRRSLGRFGNSREIS